MWDQIVLYASKVPAEVWLALGGVLVTAVTGVHVAPNDKIESVSEKIAKKTIARAHSVKLPGKWGIIYNIVAGTLPAILRGILKALPEQQEKVEPPPPPEYNPAEIIRKVKEGK